MGGTGIRSDLLYQPEELPLKYEAGTPNTVGLAALEAGVGYILREGVEKLQEAAVGQQRKIIAGLRVMEAVVIYGDTNRAELPVTSFNIAGVSPEDVGYLLEESFGICVRAGLHCAPLIHEALGSMPAGMVRVSGSAFTRDDDVKQFLQAVEQIHAGMAVK